MSLRVADLLARKRETLQLEVVAGEAGLERKIEAPEVSSPGLALTGYTDRFVTSRVQVLGQTEISYLASLPEERLAAALEFVFGSGIPCVFVTKGLELPAGLAEIADRAGVAVLRTAMKTGDFFRRIQPYLEEEFAPRTSLHGSLADVYGVGLLFQGPSGIGKSECVLDLVERGHRLVADDVVLAHRRGPEVLIGRGHELQQYHVEIRGVGIIDVRAMFGIRAVRQQKRIEVVVQLEEWSESGTYDRTGLERRTTDVLGVSLPLVVVPLNPGKNITVIAEVVAMNHLLRYSGVDSAEAFQETLLERMRPVREYLEVDDE
ncbi:MAG: HPr(Ser) kinase/phosphatase [Gemmatimonadota bacterium]|nr:HPr(Ser) kinase/phosphatase [Gemmatimonadota bacterium]